MRGALKQAGRNSPVLRPSYIVFGNIVSVTPRCLSIQYSRLFREIILLLRVLPSHDHKEDLLDPLKFEIASIGTHRTTKDSEDASCE